MKIVQIIRSLKGGGAEKVVQTLAKTFASLGYESIIILLDRDEELKELEGIKLLYASSKKLVLTLKTINPDLILAHMKTPQKILKNVYLDNLFFVIHSTQSQRLKQRRFLTNRLYRFRVGRLQKLFNGHKLVTVSKGIADDLIHELKILPKSLHTIYNPFEICKIQQKSRESIPLRKPYIIHVGRLKKIKRQDILLKAYAKSNIGEDLIILGDGEELENLKKLTKKLNLMSKVHFLGWKENPYPYMKHAKLFVLSSAVEGFGNVLAESLIVGTPAVSTNCQSGPSEILVNELSSFLVDVNDIEALAKKIREALKSNIKISSKYYQHFDAEVCAREYFELIN